MGGSCVSANSEPAWGFRFKGFQFSTTHEKSLLNIVQVGSHYELRINNQSFDYLYGSKKSQSIFKQDSEPYIKPASSVMGPSSSYHAKPSTGTSSGWKDVEAIYK